MIKIENIEVTGWRHAIRGMRNPMNSWEKSNSCTQGSVWCNEFCENSIPECDKESGLYIGPNDLNLMKQLRSAGTDHRKFMRMIAVYLDITAPLYWWKEFDTYKVGTVANSCSTMHKIQAKEFDRGDFSHEHIPKGSGAYSDTWDIKTSGMFFCLNEEDGIYLSSEDILDCMIRALNHYREKYLVTGDKKYWWQMIQLLPSSYNQKRTIMLNYEVLANIYKSRRNHKLDEWVDFCKWIETLPYSVLITSRGEK
ncbi:MAG: hypothetical protein Q4C65_02515 [Eubacteriales bacterium]|nr:hypothetical protein [Eubacteriales bacterium]